LRLKGAEDNLLRLQDVLEQIDAQIESLRRQAKQSTRYAASPPKSAATRRYPS